MPKSHSRAKLVKLKGLTSQPQHAEKKGEYTAKIGVMWLVLKDLHAREQ